MDSLGLQQNATVAQGVNTNANIGQVQVTQSNVQQPVNAQSGVSNQGLFTQDQLNGIITGRVNPLNQKIAELTAQLNTQQQIANTYLTELTGFKQTSHVVGNLKVPEQFVDYVKFEANKRAVNGKSFEDAASEFVTSNPHLFSQTSLNSQVSTLPQGSVATQQANQEQQQLQSSNAGLLQAGALQSGVLQAGAITVPNTTPATQVVGSTGFNTNNVTNPSALGYSEEVMKRYGYGK